MSTKVLLCWSHIPQHCSLPSLIKFVCYKLSAFCYYNLRPLYLPPSPLFSSPVGYSNLYLTKLNNKHKKNLGSTFNCNKLSKFLWGIYLIVNILHARNLNSPLSIELSPTARTHCAVRSSLSCLRVATSFFIRSRP